MNQLEQWIGKGRKTFTLLYKITRDGCSSTTFHQKCDNQGATVTVLYHQKGSVFGGYASVSWNSTSAYIPDSNAFLFQLTPTLRMFPRNGVGNELYGCSNYGPIFGGGHDLLTFSSQSNHSVDGIFSPDCSFSLDGTMNLGHSYDNQSVTQQHIYSGTMVVTEMEVYKVSDGKSVVKDITWRKTKKWNEKLMDELMDDIVNFEPLSDIGSTVARILLIGPVGAGKSSFCNTVNSIFRGRITLRAGSGSAEQSLTTKYNPYPVRLRSGTTLKFKLCDTRGLEETQGIDILECNYLLDGHVPEYYQFNPSAPIKPDSMGFISKPTVDDKVHCVVFVVDGTTLDVLSEKILQKIKSFQAIIIQKGIPQVLLLTKIDKLCEAVSADISVVFRSTTIEKQVDKASQILGLPRANILPFKNYENEIELDESISILALLSMRQILNFVGDYMENLQDRMKVEQRVELDVCNKNRV